MIRACLGALLRRLAERIDHADARAARLKAERALDLVGQARAHALAARSARSTMRARR